MPLNLQKFITDQLNFAKIEKQLTSAIIIPQYLNLTINANTEYMYYQKFCSSLSDADDCTVWCKKVGIWETHIQEILEFKENCTFLYLITHKIMGNLTCFLGKHFFPAVDVEMTITHLKGLYAESFSALCFKCHCSLVCLLDFLTLIVTSFVYFYSRLGQILCVVKLSC